MPRFIQPDPTLPGVTYWSQGMMQGVLIALPGWLVEHYGCSASCHTAGGLGALVSMVVMWLFTLAALALSVDHFWINTLELQTWEGVRLPENLLPTMARIGRLVGALTLLMLVLNITMLVASPRFSLMAVVDSLRPVVLLGVLGTIWLVSPQQRRHVE